ncbi:EpsG family protein [Psychroflexus sediminis]|uniref:EpsG family protein n=1 Tax=Psychroflexus sediminis TaxID=470826 RepID=A0A1G7Z274_9FLAO|nr:EpsG family protein [Psychroflexus sediminis]SDH02892.1 EpsG family protein [Psychroflexus sediminis]
MIDRPSFFLLFQSIYALIAFGALLVSSKVLVSNQHRKDFFSSDVLPNFFILLITIIVGLRAYNVGTDTGNYFKAWNDISSISFSADFLYYLVMLLVKYLGYSYQAFLVVDAAIFFITLYVALKKICNYYKINLYLVLFAFLSFFFSLSLSINVVRQGNSLMFLLLAYAFILNKGSTKKIFLACLIAIFLHLTALIPIILYFFVARFKFLKSWHLLLIYIAALVLSFLNYGVLNLFPEFITELMEGDKRLSYLEEKETKYITGFKPQFAVFNTVFLLIGLYLKKYRLNSLDFEKLLNYYILASALFFMAFQIPFSDRWGLFSWVVIPLIIGQLFTIVQPKRFDYILPTFFLISIFIFFINYE